MVSVRRFSALVLSIVLASSPANAAEKQSLPAVLDYWSEAEHDQRIAMFSALAGSGVIALGVGTTVLLTSDKYDYGRRDFGMVAVGAGAGIAAGSIPLLITRGPHEKLRRSLERGASEATVEHDWETAAHDVRLMRLWAGGIGIGIGVLAMGGGGVLAFTGDDTEHRRTVSGGLLAFGAIETLFGALALALPSAVEGSWETYRRASAVSVRPSPIVLQRGGGVGVVGSF